ncbi:unnamed protein product [Closterium sp. NIES-53]
MPGSGGTHSVRKLGALGVIQATEAALRSVWQPASLPTAPAGAKNVSAGTNTPQTSHTQRTTHEAAGPTGSHENAAAAGAGYHQSLHAARLHLDQHHRCRHLHHRCHCLHRRCCYSLEST